ncbi:MAG: DUF2500 domain-containing protein [Ruminococcaceae bacterium]|nr:DUF2500 domain-containing protein [Oscillospiraceae bacterium]
MPIGFGMFGVMFTLMFVLVFGIFIYTFAKSIGRWHQNNQSPRLTVPATVVAKRSDVRHRHHDHHTHYHSYYFATFQVESGDRMELELDGSEYGLLVEGDTGELTFQGTRFLGFVRT